MTNTEKSKFDRDSFHDFVESHGEGSPTEEGYNLGELLILLGDDYATAAAEVSRRGMTFTPSNRA